ncbi:FkbM family methyltransferase [Methylopila capsulata]|uniref:Methyltransferase n=1 Tax=Methylopila capsulata TaxID=61654 RepID=A0A9W6IVT3_9HYPH|nr:FkbM family methyltransferase [Methylopila capsulata]MBM7852902.1 FkbM family methyltransferase [Methylopila capsulata]GLK57113.1 methyltransferase [Methylopila capsulata]
MTDAVQTDPPYGAHRPPRVVETLRALGSRVPANAAGLRLASLLRQICFAAGAGPYDVEVFPSVHARLRPATNRTEKRVFLAPHLWDAEERGLLEGAVLEGDPEAEATFVDVGANVGFYGLSLASVARRAGRRLRVIAIEPDPTNRARLAANVAASGLDVTIDPSAVGREPGAAFLIEHARNRGEVRLVNDARGDGVEVEVQPLPVILARHGVVSVDAMKVDVEGMDFEALAGLFEQAPAAQLPRMLVVEVGRTAAEAGPMLQLLASNGYRIAARTRLNVVAARSV